jgi:DNA repair and recombination protein RAD54B
VETDLSEDERESLRAGVIPPMSPNMARYRHQVGDLKARAVAELLHEELSTTDQKRVVFCYHRSVLDYLQRELFGYGLVRIDGDTTPTQREENVRQFRELDSRRVFLGQINACGTGLDGLQYAAHEAIIVEPDWSRDTNVQAAHRLARIGQVNPVQVRMIALYPSLDEAIVRQFKRECEMVERIVG